MPRIRKHIGLLSAAVAFTLLASGCFQPAGAGLEATNLADAQSFPTFTPMPSETPTETPTQTFTPSVEPTVITATPSLAFEQTATLVPLLVTATVSPTPLVVADAALQNIDPIWQTATAIFLQQTGGLLIEPTATPDVGAIDPLLLTATQLVRNATLAVEVPLTQTAQALLGPTLTPTFDFVVQPTATPFIFVSGTDCVHQVQPTDRNLYRLGLEYGVHYLDIAYYPPNNIVNPNLIYIGQKIVIPNCGSTGKIPPPTWTPTATSSVATFAPGSTSAYPTFTGAYPTYTGAPVEYTVQPGDTLFRLSLTYGLPLSTILSRNPQITNINLIYVGDIIVIG